MERHNNCDAENFFVTASKEELIDYLVKKINSEVEKGDGADCDLIRECSDWLDELTQDEIVFTPEEIERNLEKIKANVVSDKPLKRHKKMSPKSFMRVALIAALLFTISILALSAVARNNGYGSTWEFIYVSGGKLLGLDNGEEIQDDGITVIKNAEESKYNSIADFLKAESLSILYPQPMPSNVTIKQIRFEYVSDTDYTLSFDLSNKSYAFFVTSYYSVDTSTLNSFESVSINNQNYSITSKKQNIYYAIFQNNDLEYTIQAPTYDDLISILSNMKG